MYLYGLFHRKLPKQLELQRQSLGKGFEKALPHCSSWNKENIDNYPLFLQFLVCMKCANKFTQFKSQVLLCSIPGKRFCLCATGCIISWQSRGLTPAEGPQSRGEFGCSSGEKRLLCTLDICLLSGEENEKS